MDILPSEIILHICSYLPDASQFNLLICNRILSGLIAKIYLNDYYFQSETLNKKWYNKITKLKGVYDIKLLPRFIRSIKMSFLFTDIIYTNVLPETLEKLYLYYSTTLVEQSSKKLKIIKENLNTFIISPSQFRTFSPINTFDISQIQLPSQFRTFSSINTFDISLGYNYIRIN